VTHAHDEHETKAHASSVAVMRRLLDANDHEAQHNRAHFDAAGVFAINLMSAPGAGKTALLEATIKAVGSWLRLAVVEGDLATENDAERIRRHGVPAVQITTGTACHLDAHMVHDVLHALPLAGLDVLFIENVGNLVCPAAFDLGQHRNVTLLSVTEGDDKPAKYPVIFRASDLVLLSKTDLLAHFDDFDVARAEGCVRGLANEAPVLTVSARAPGGLDAWLDWLTWHLAGHWRARRVKTEPQVAQ
jgi:hydrogenase nickel incorporation protein HypB